jgi:hypothetical protein
MKCLLIILFLITLFSCTKKDVEPECVTWIIFYWQGKADHTTITSNYYPYSKDEKFCGSEKQVLEKGKIAIIRQVNANLYDYKTYQGQR